MGNDQSGPPSTARRRSEWTQDAARSPIAKQLGLKNAQDIENAMKGISAEQISAHIHFLKKLHAEKLGQGEIEFGDFDDTEVGHSSDDDVQSASEDGQPVEDGRPPAMAMLTDRDQSVSDGHVKAESDTTAIDTDISNTNGLNASEHMGTEPNLSPSVKKQKSSLQPERSSPDDFVVAGSREQPASAPDQKAMKRPKTERKHKKKKHKSSKKRSESSSKTDNETDRSSARVKRHRSRPDKPHQTDDVDLDSMVSQAISSPPIYWKNRLKNIVMPFQSVEVAPDSATWRQIDRAIRTSVAKEEKAFVPVITHVERIENPLLWRQYTQHRYIARTRLMREAMQEQSLGKDTEWRSEETACYDATLWNTHQLDRHSNETFLFFAIECSGNELMRIELMRRIGFTVRSASMNAQFTEGHRLHSEAVVFTESIADLHNLRLNSAPQSDDEFRVILSRVALGAMATRPDADGGQPCQEWASCNSRHCAHLPRLNSVRIPGPPCVCSRFAVYTPELCYPEYVITYKL